METGLNVESEAAEMVGTITSSASVEDGVEATVTTAPEIDETVVDPREAPDFWERMNAQSDASSRPPEFLSTHPGPEKRIAKLNNQMDEALKYYNKEK